MKKIILSLTVAAAALLATESNAQISNDKGTFTKPVAGNVLVELQVTPNIIGGGVFNLNDPFLVNLGAGLNTAGIEGATGTAQDFDTDLAAFAPSLKGRYFLSDASALRVQLGFLSASRTLKGENGAGDATKDRISRGGFNLAIGYEKHFEGAERLSTYAGADLLFGMASAKSKFDDGTDELEAKQSGIGFGLRAVTGFDYYFIPKVYIGGELGLGLSYNSYGVVKASGGGLEDGVDKSSNFTLTPFVIPAIRLGYNF
ncbi:MAG: hypothetical protein K0R51_777 [Cytophagaceae bacterium]|jgi:hypothetical protein|nr:hypothetical protein [Cytophagaceae bacterium]